MKALFIVHWLANINCEKPQSGAASLVELRSFADIAGQFVNLSFDNF